MQRQLDANGKRKLRRLWRGELTIHEVAQEMEITLEELESLAADLGLPERTEPDVYIPTTLEIQTAAAEIRAKWTSVERESRLKMAHSATLRDTGRHNEAS